MRRRNVLIILGRELRDQVRDRRTLFMVLVLPILLYPVLGFTVTQLAASFESKARTVIVLGAANLPESPPLLDPSGRGFAAGLFESPEDARRLEVVVVADAGAWTPEKRRISLRSGESDAIVVVPDDLRAQIAATQDVELPIVYNGADEQSDTTFQRVRDLLGRWKREVVAGRLAADDKPAGYTEPIRVRAENVATRAESGGTLWARLVPFLLVMMSLTGAFYPAVDLCAGEKERGTMETLLISPASRGEIVLGKFLTVFVASIATALMNLASLAVTGLFLADKVGGSAGGPGSPMGAIGGLLSPPPATAVVWIVLLLVPLSAFFSALCLALAVLARSMKEGQYYMTPLYLVTMPLIFLTLVPGVELKPFYSLVPVTGVALLLKSLLQGQYHVARVYFLPVLVPTLVYAWMALRWAVAQFMSESVLFREAEQVDPIGWARYAWRRRGPTPKPGAVVTCFAAMLALAWYVSLLLGGANPLRSLVIGHALFILAPPLVLTFLLTNSPRTTLRLRWPSARHLAIGAGLAVALHPLIAELRPWVEALFPVSESVGASLKALMDKVPDLATAVLLFAMMPAITEEVAFRGFILSGLENGFRRRDAIVVSALLFGFFHVVLSLAQQLVGATLLGLVLGLLAVRSRSLLPGVVFHFLNNAIVVTVGYVAADSAMRSRATWLFRDPEAALLHWPWVAAGGVVAAVLLTMLIRERDKKSAEAEL